VGEIEASREAHSTTYAAVTKLISDGSGDGDGGEHSKANFPIRKSGNLKIQSSFTGAQDPRTIQTQDSSLFFQFCFSQPLSILPRRNNSTEIWARVTNTILLVAQGSSSSSLFCAFLCGPDSPQPLLRRTSAGRTPMFLGEGRPL
jgi:hypothetical protein